MLGPDQDGLYARVSPSPARRYFAVGVLMIIGVLLLYVALSQPPAPLAMIFMLVVGLGALWLGERLWRATALSVELTQEGLKDNSGRVIARWDEIKRVERGALAFKPSNGFLLTLEQPQPRAWVPGLWWRVGRRVGIGGITPAGEGRYMADQIAFRLSQREGESDG